MRSRLLAVALFAAGLPVAAGAQPAASQGALPPRGALPQTFEQLRVQAVGDQLVRYLAHALQWVDNPDSRAPASALALTLAAAVDAHPEARAASAQRLGAAFGTREAQAAQLPQVGAAAEIGGRRNDPVSTIVNRVPGFEDRSGSLSLTARQLVWDFGAAAYQIESRAAQEDAVRFRARAKRSELTLRALSAWLEVFRARQLLNAALMNTASRLEIVRFLQERESLGASPRSDVLRAQARLTDARALEVATRSRLAGAEAVYAEFFGNAPVAVLALPALPPLDAGRAADIERIVDASPLVAEARRQAESASAEARAAQADTRPTVSAEFGLQRRDLMGSGAPGTDWNVGLSLRHNLYSGGAETARVQRAVQRAREASLAEASLRLQLERALTQTAAEVGNGDAALAARKEAAQVAAVALEAVREQFAFRRGSLLDLLRAQEELHQATRDLIDALTDQTLQRYRFLHLAAELAPMFGVAVDAPAPPVAPTRWWPGGR